MAAHFGETVRDGFKLNTKSSLQYKPPKTELHPVTDNILQYFSGRSISENTLKAFNVSSDSHGNIVFPFTCGGELVYVKHRKPAAPKKDEPKEWADPDTRPILFGMDMCSSERPLIITEGMIDALSLYEVGVRNVVSVPSGCENFKWIEECWDWLERFEEVVLFGDNDAPGRQMISRLVKRLGESRCKIVEEYPVNIAQKECKDANEILYSYGKEGLKKGCKRH